MHIERAAETRKNGFEWFYGRLVHNLRRPTDTGGRNIFSLFVLGRVQALSPSHLAGLFAFAFDLNNFCNIMCMPHTAYTLDGLAMACAWSSTVSLCECSRTLSLQRQTTSNKYSRCCAALFSQSHSLSLWLRADGANVQFFMRNFLKPCPLFFFFTNSFIRSVRGMGSSKC